MSNPLRKTLEFLGLAEESLDEQGGQPRSRFLTCRLPLHSVLQSPRFVGDPNKG